MLQLLVVPLLQHGQLGMSTNTCRKLLLSTPTAHKNLCAVKRHVDPAEQYLLVRSTETNVRVVS